MRIKAREKLGLVSLETGEIVHDVPAGANVTIRSDREQEIVDAKVQQKKIEEAIQEKDWKRITESSVGGNNGRFVWCIYEAAKMLFPEIKPASLARLMLLATYMNYDGELSFEDKTPLTKKDAQDILRLGARMFRYTMEELEDVGAIKWEDAYVMNTAMFKKGAVKNEDGKLLVGDRDSISKLYAEGVRALYNAAAPGAARKLSYIFRVMPFVNKRFNIICKNPLEEAQSRVVPMSLGDLADAIGYGRKNAKKLQDALVEPRFECDGRLVRAVKYVSGNNVGIENHCLFINPHIYYGGKDFKDVGVLSIFDQDDIDN